MASNTSASTARVVPAQLGFLAIYSPALGDSDETFHQQIVFYYTQAAQARAKAGAASELAAALHEEENEKLRQVGLAQGMVGFARSFSRGESVDSIETERSRIVLHELEAGWWILASVDLTQLPGPSPSAAVEYSSREVSPPALLVQQLVRAHAVFTLHHGWPLAHLLDKHGRAKFCSIVHTYWTRFCATWDVLLHGSPAVDMFNGLKLAAGGELGMGVGEEEWGSGERDVLEDFARRTEGLVDVVVSRFGEAHDRKPAADDALYHDSPWIGSGRAVTATDGVVFSGVGGLSRASLRDVAHWTESIYHSGDHAYGVRDNPTSDRRRRRRRDPASKKKPDAPADAPADGPQHDSGTGEAPRIPAPIVSAVESSLDRASHAVDEGRGTALASLGDTETWIKYMTLGYGTAWGRARPDRQDRQDQPDQQDQQDVRLPQHQEPQPRHQQPQPQPLRYVEPAPDVDVAAEKRRAQVRAENDGYFIVGLKGDMAEADMDGDESWNARIPLRTVYVEAVNKPSSASESDSTPTEETPPSSYAGVKLETSRLRPVVYVHRPFIYTFLFAHRTPSLTFTTFYRSLHAFFAPLHASLDRNTAPSRVAQRLLAAASPHTTPGQSQTPIYDLVWDPRTLTLHTSLPNIPAPGLASEGLANDEWSRVDALNVHAQLLAVVASTRRRRDEIERTCKTARGWWVVWMRLPPSRAEEDSLQSQSRSQAEAEGEVEGEGENSRPSQEHSSPEKSSPDDNSGTTSTAFNTHELREAFLIRRARDNEAAQTKPSVASGIWSGLGMGATQTHSQTQRIGGRAATAGGSKGSADGVGMGLGMGMGIDARRYVDALLSLNR